MFQPAGIDRAYFPFDPDILKDAAQAVSGSGQRANLDFVTIGKLDLLRLAPSGERRSAPDELFLRFGGVTAQISSEFAHKVTVAPCKSTAAVQPFHE
ncbi:hypothetical protein QW131_14385 [Roseibium salinum]|nr:hypothetical protein [Roseibium salinum]